METELSVLWQLAVLLVLVLFYNLFMLASVGILHSRGSQLKEMNFKKGGVKLTRYLLAHADHYILTAQLGKFFVVLLMGVCLVSLTNSLVVWGDGNFALPVSGDVLFLILFCSVLVLFTLGAVILIQVGRSFAFESPERTLYYLAPLFLWLSRLLAPLVAVISFVVAKALQPVKLSAPVERELAISAEEISEIVEFSSQAGEIEEDEREMIQGVFGFSETLVREVMTPRVDISAVPDNVTLEEIVKIFSSEGLSRLLVYGDDLDDVKGLLLAKDLIPLVGQGAVEFKLDTLLRVPHVAAVTQPVDELLKEFRDEATHFAVVLDEHGGVQGIVTMEDLIEEIVGEISDEFDDPEQEVQELRSGDLLVGGGADIDDLNEKYDFAFPEGEYDTIAGFVIKMLGHIPRKGEVVHYEGVRIQVDKVAQNRVILLKVSGHKDRAK
ncbi:hemolysin family protein [Oligoflexia bacterium]|nr:hemolysin family protein [Oligoflexia bacterium]